MALVKVHVKGVAYPVDIEEKFPDLRENQLIKQVTGLKAGQFYKALDEMATDETALDTDVLVALAIIAIKRNRPDVTVKELDALYDGGLDSITFEQVEQEPARDASPPADPGAAAPPELPDQQQTIDT